MEHTATYLRKTSEKRMESGTTHKIMLTILSFFSTLDLFLYIKNGFSTVAIYSHFVLSIFRPFFPSSCLFFALFLFRSVLGAGMCQNKLLDYRLVEW
jgi:hypothetical protein